MKSILYAMTFVLFSSPLFAGEVESLFDGKTLKGWKGLPQFWSVQDGAIVGQTTKENPTKGNTFLVWQGDDLADFELTAKVRFQGNNSGIQYRSWLLDDEKYIVKGYQCDLHPSQDFFGMLYAEKWRGIVAKRGQKVEVGSDKEVTVVGSVGDNTKLVDTEWNEVRIVAVGNRLIHQVNGNITMDLTDNHPEAPDKGILALQLHQGPPMKVEFKDIKLRRLDGDAARETLIKVITGKSID